MLYNYHYWR